MTLHTAKCTPPCRFAETPQVRPATGARRWQLGEEEIDGNEHGAAWHYQGGSPAVTGDHLESRQPGGAPDQGGESKNAPPWATDPPAPLSPSGRNKSGA